MAPSFPVTVTVEVAFGADPEADPSGWSWTDVSSDVRYADRVRIGRGRSDERSDAEPSQCAFTLLNGSGDYTPGNATGAHYPDVTLGVPVRVTVTTDSVDYRRFSGFVSKWAPEWPEGDLSPPFALVRVSCDGILRRMRQGEQALNSAAFRSLSMSDHVVAFWPCEDGSEATEAASPIMGVAPMVPSGVEFGASREQSDSILYGASQVMKIPDPARNVMGRVPNHTPGDVYVVELAWMMPEEATVGTRAVMDVRTTSADFARWQIGVSSTTFRLRAWDADDTEVINDTEPVNSALWGQWVRAELRLDEDSGKVSARAWLFAADETATELNSGQNLSNTGAMGRVTQAGVNGPKMGQERYAGHIAVLTGTAAELPISPESMSSLDRHPPFHAHTAELAADRFERLCDEQGLSCSIVTATGGLELPGESGSTASAPDAAALDITGDLEIRAWLRVDEWASGVAREIASKWDDTVNEASFAFWVSSGGGLGLSWTTDGTLGTASAVNSSALAPLPPDEGLLAVAVTLDVDDGASGHVVTLYAHPDIDADLSDWTEVHSETNAGTTSIYSGSADLVVGSDQIEAEISGLVKEVRVYDGIGGTLVADPDFTGQTVGASSFSDDAGNTWTVNGNAAIVRADDSMPMGPQPVDTLTAQFAEIEVADGGIVGEDDFGLFYRTRTDLTNQAAALALDATTDIVNPFRPALDDLGRVTDVTATRPDGTSVRAVDSSKSTYKDSPEINVSTDDWLRQVAHWLLHLGTLPGMRYPRVSPALTRTPTLITSWGVLDEGDRVTVTNLPAEHPADDVDLLARGWSEELSPDEWLASINASPAAPYDVAVFGTARFDAADSSTSGSFEAGTDTSLTVTTAAGHQPWINSTDHASEFPFEIEVSGVVLNVTAVSSATSPQTFTVDATPTNGVTKTIASGSAVTLADSPVFAL